MGFWSEPTSTEIMAKRAGGRRRYNAQRKRAAAARRAQVESLMVHHWDRPDMLASIARDLQVHPSTVSRDLAALGLREVIKSVREEERTLQLGRGRFSLQVLLSRAKRKHQVRAIVDQVFAGLSFPADLLSPGDMFADLPSPGELLR